MNTGELFLAPQQHVERDEPRLRLADNPILIAQARRRLRLVHATPTLAIVALLAVCAVVAGFSQGRPEAWQLLYSGLLGLAGLILYVASTHQVSAIVAEDQESGLLQFHRASPTTPWTDAVGYLFGGASREYLAFGLLAPFVLLCGAMAQVGLGPAALGLLAILLAGCMYQSFALLMGLSLRNKRRRQSATVTIAILYLSGAPSLAIPGGMPTMAHLTPLPTLLELGAVPRGRIGSLSFYGIEIGNAVYATLLQVVLTVVMLSASARKLRRENGHAFSRFGAIAFLWVIALLFAGPMWGTLRAPHLAANVLWSSMAVSLAVVVALTLSVVPSYLEFGRCLRRARRAGRTPRWSEEGATIWPMAIVWCACFAGIVALYSVLGVLSGHFDLSAWGRGGALALAGAATSAIALVVGATEYVHLRHRGAARGVTVLLAFLLLGLPWILGAILGGSSDLARYIYSASPLMGLASAADAFTAQLAGRHSTLMENQSFGLISIGLTAVYAAIFHWRARDLRRDIDGRIALADAPVHHHSMVG